MAMVNSLLIEIQMFGILLRDKIQHIVKNNNLVIIIMVKSKVSKLTRNNKGTERPAIRVEQEMIKEVNMKNLGLKTQLILKRMPKAQMNRANEKHMPSMYTHRGEVLILTL
jgi:hypothetical protein